MHSQKAYAQSEGVYTVTGLMNRQRVYAQTEG